MDRRNFLFSAVTSAAVLPLIKLKAADNLNPNSFSIEILTDTPETAISKLSSVINNFSNKIVSFSERKLYGNYTGDLTFVLHNKLVDFRRSNSKISKELSSVASFLGLPGTLRNPVWLSFKTKELQKPSFFEIYRNNDLYKIIELNKSKNLIVQSDAGELELSFINNSARVISSSCRHKTCAEKGPINSLGENIICIPNKIRISIC